MPLTALTVKTPPGPHPGTIAADAADFTWEAGDAANGNDFTPTGEEMLLVRNDDVGAQTVTITTVADEKSRTGDITAYSIGAGEYAFFGPFAVDGWRHPDGKIHVAVSDANIKFALVRVR